MNPVTKNCVQSYEHLAVSKWNIFFSTLSPRVMYLMSGGIPIHLDLAAQCGQRPRAGGQVPRASREPRC